MYITETTENVREIFNKLENNKDIYKIKFLLYIFNSLNNSQINNKNESNPNLNNDDDIKVFDFSLLGFEENYITMFLQHNISIYNNLIKNNEAYENNGSVMGINFDNNVISDFERLTLKEKLDVFSEIIIRYDNETYFEDKTIAIFDFGKNGFEIANLILQLKESDYFNG